jgi:hypothetical protein
MARNGVRFFAENRDRIGLGIAAGDPATGQKV